MGNRVNKYFSDIISNEQPLKVPGGGVWCCGVWCSVVWWLKPILVFSLSLNQAEQFAKNIIRTFLIGNTYIEKKSICNNKKKSVKGQS